MCACCRINIKWLFIKLSTRFDTSLPALPLHQIVMLALYHLRVTLQTSSGDQTFCKKWKLPRKSKISFSFSFSFLFYSLKIQLTTIYTTDFGLLLLPLSLNSVFQCHCVGRAHGYKPQIWNITFITSPIIMSVAASDNRMLIIHDRGEKSRSDRCAAYSLSDMPLGTQRNTASPCLTPWN